ncbi:MAG TPA: sensor domain-containing diguanylate cyclase [Acidimicrobiales bacterium]|nr:sensor domain-containing diguanylate cyclase [Acidimicrobiales bacterium]
MTSPSAGSIANEMVPLADRLRHMRVFRLTLVLAIGALLLFSPEIFRVGKAELGEATAGYLAIAFACEGLWRVFRRRAITLFGLLVILDGIYLAWGCYVSGGVTSPVRFAMILHLIAIVLLASYRTGLKLAMWDSLLTLVVFYAQDVKLSITVGGRVVPDSSFHRLITFITLFWLVALATAAFSAVNERELRRRKYDLEALARLAKELDETGGSREAAKVLVDRVADTFDLHRVILVGEGGEQPAVLAHHGPLGTIGDATNGSEGAGVLERARDNKETLLTSGLAAAHDRWLSDLLPESRNLILMPLWAEGHCLGVLVAEHSMRKGSRIERRVVSMLERFGSHGALALRNASLLEQVQKMASTDGLTGVANRRAFDAALDRELARAARLDDPVSLVMLDIDHFKALNDTHGHQMGDDVLRAMAAILAQTCRAYDTVARYGGEEFAVILPGCTDHEAMAMAERFREVVVTTGSPVAITASVGVATFPVHASGATGLVRAADRALYVSKRAGRNQVSLALEVSPV